MGHIISAASTSPFGPFMFAILAGVTAPSAVLVASSWMGLHELSSGLGEALLSFPGYPLLVSAWRDWYSVMTKGVHPRVVGSFNRRRFMTGGNLNGLTAFWFLAVFPFSGIGAVFLIPLVSDFRQSVCRAGPLRFSLSEAVV